MTKGAHVMNGAVEGVRYLFGFGPDEAPNAMAERALHEGDVEELRHLAPDERQQVLSWWLGRALVKSSRETADGRVVDGGLLLSHWQALPERARQIFPEHFDSTLEEIGAAGEVQLGRTMEAARALLDGAVSTLGIQRDEALSETGCATEKAAEQQSAPRGPTVREIRERAKQNRQQGLSRNGRLYKKGAKE